MPASATASRNASRCPGLQWYVTNHVSIFDSSRFEILFDDPAHIVGERRVPLTNEAIYKFEKTRDAFNHPTVMFRKSTVERAGGYSDYKKNQDSDLWIRLMSQHAVCMNLEEALVYFRFDEDTYQRRKNWHNIKTLLDIRYRAWKSGFNTMGEFLFLAAAQLGIFVMPEWVQKFVYRNFLRS